MQCKMELEPGYGETKTILLRLLEELQMESTDWQKLYWRGFLPSVFIVMKE